MTCKRNVPYLSNLIGVTTCDMLIYFAPVLPVTCPDPVFWQGCRAYMKNVVSGDETNYSHAYVLEPHAGRGWRFRWGARWGWCSFPRKCTRRAYHWCKWIQLHFSSVTRTLCWLSKPLVYRGVSESVPYVGELSKYLGSLYKFPGTDITQSQYCVYSFGNMELV